MQQRWKEHFVELLNRHNPESEVISDMEVIEEIPSGRITKAEIRSAITSMKVGKAPGVDCLTVELLKADITTTVDVLHDLFCEIWVSETVPTDWRRGLIVKIAKKGGSHQVWKLAEDYFDVCRCKSDGQGIDQKNIRWC